MSKAKQKSPKKPTHVGSFLLKRVFRKGSAYICGICRQHHDYIEDANHCIERCWGELLTGSPLRIVKRIGRYEFACIFCQRSYVQDIEALRCADECSSKMTISSLDGSDLAQNRVRRSFQRHTYKPQVQFHFRISGKDNSHLDHHDNAEQQAFDDTARADVSLLATEGDGGAGGKTKKPKSVDEEAASAPKQDRTQKFERVGAKYACLICKKKYFERAEVEKCFDSHTSGASIHENSGV